MTRPCAPRFPLLATWGLLLLVVVPAVAQRPTETFGETVEVRVINLDVVVTDRQGQRVTDLGPEDFRLRVDGEERAIDYFTEVRDGRAVDGASGAAAPGVAPGQAVPVNFLIFVDRRNSFEGNVRRIFARLSDDIESLGPRDQVAVVSFGSGKLIRHTGWTSSPERIQAALDEVLEAWFGGIYRVATDLNNAADVNNLESFLAEGNAEGNEARIAEVESPYEHFQTVGEHGQMEQMTGAAAAAMRAMAAPSGRKVMLVLAGGWVSTFPSYVTDGRQQEHLFRMTETANLLGYTLYAADAPIQRFGSEVEQHEALDFLAEKTGGLSMHQFASLDVLGKAVEDTRTYYWMGFTAEASGEGEVSKIQLDVRRPGLRVRARKEVTDLSRRAEVDQLVHTTHRVEDLPSVLGLEFEFGDAVRQGRSVHVPIGLTIPLDSIALLPGPDGHTARLELRVSTLDGKGVMSEVAVLPVTFSGDRPQPGQHATYTAALDLRHKKSGGDLDIVLALYDTQSGAILMGEDRLRL